MAKTRTKKPTQAHSPDQVIQTTMGVIPAGQPMQVPYSAHLAPKAYSSWMFAVASIRANAVASVPLRLYSMSSAKVKAMGFEPVRYGRRPVPARRKRYLMGRDRVSPHSTVVSKSVSMDGEMEEIIGSPASELLRKANPWQGGFELMTMMCLNLNLSGMAYWYVDRSGPGGTPSLVMDLAPKRIEIVPGKANFIEGYIYGRGEANQISLLPDEVVYFRRPNPRSPWYGMGFVEAAWDVILQNNAIHEMDTAFFSNYARPDYLAVVANTNASDDALKRFRSNVASQVGGKSKTGRMLAVTGDVDIKPLSFPPKDLSGRDGVVEEICAIGGVPVTMVKANDPNLASAQQGYAMYRENSIAVDCRLIEDVLNQSYLKMWGIDDQAFFAFDNPIIEDEKREYDLAREDLKVGVFSINTRRAEMGYEPDPDPMADRLLFNGQPLGSAAMVAQSTLGQTGTSEDTSKPDTVPTTGPQNSTQIAADAGAAVQDTALNGAQVSSLIELVSKVTAKEMPAESAIAVAAAAFPLITPEQINAIFNPLRRFEAATPEPVQVPNTIPQPAPQQAKCAKEVSAIGQKAFLYGDVTDGCTCCKALDPTEDEETTRIINRFVSSLEPVLAEQAKAVISKLEAAGVPTAGMLVEVQKEIIDQKWVERIKDAAREPIMRGIVNGVDTGVKLLPVQLRDRVSFDYQNPEVDKYVRNQSLRLAENVNETTAANVRQTLGDGMANGESIQQMTDRVKTTMQVDGSRAETIARTETAKAQTQGQLQTWKQTDGIVTGKQWVLAPDACEFCRAAARQFADTPKPLGEPFYKLGDVIQGVKGGVMAVDYENIDGPPLHPNDRCSVIPVTEES